MAAPRGRSCAPGGAQGVCWLVLQPVCDEMGGFYQVLALTGVPIPPPPPFFPPHVQHSAWSRFSPSPSLPRRRRRPSMMLFVLPSLSCPTVARVACM